MWRHTIGWRPVVGEARRRREAAKAGPRSTLIFPGLTAGPHEAGKVREETMRRVVAMAGGLLVPNGQRGWHEWPISEVFAVLPHLFGDNPTEREEKFAADAYKHANTFPGGQLIVAFVEAMVPPGTTR